jgi:citrate lyase subunit beta/citryl-CoA lyase
MISPATVWRSMLFIPAHVEKFVQRAHTRGADAYILDLEDSVPAGEKAAARKLLPSGVQLVTQGGAAALIRINAELELAVPDIEAACLPGVSALVIPKVNAAKDLAGAARRIEDLERDRNINAGSVGLIAQIESVDGLSNLDEIAGSSPRLIGMTLGSEDFSASAGMEPTPQTLFWPNQQVVFACRRAGVLPFGFPASITDFTDMAAFRAHIRLARQMGLLGAFCIHPSQVPVLNEEFVPSATEIERANGVIAAYEAAARGGKGAASYRGQMIDPPVVARAQEVLRRGLSRT